MSVGAGGLRRYERGKWSVINVRAENRSDEDAEATTSVYLEDDSRTQYVRKLWVPANSIRQTWLPIHVPVDVPPDQNILHASAVQMADSNNGAVIDRRDGEQLVSESLLSLDSPALHLAMVSANAIPLTTELEQLREREAYQAVVEVRKLHDADGKVMSLSSAFLPPYPEAYQAMDQVVICSRQFADDSGGLAALRTWISRGGRAWIMLDMVGIDATRMLLGNAASFDIVDRLEFNEFSIETPGSAMVGAAPIETWIAEEPVDFVRVAADSVDVYSTIDGWPAAFELPFGNGIVVVTTLGARGWRHQHDTFAETTTPERPTSGTTRALQYLASEFNQTVTDTSALSDNIAPLLSAQLGYRVPSRGVAALVLGCNCVLLVVAGVWFAKREQLERIALVVPITTIVSGAALIALGSANTSSIPATSASFRLANISSEANTVHTDSLVAFYSPDTTELPLKVDLAGVVTPEISDLTGEAKRVVWSDDGQANWERIDVASGSVRFAHVAENKVLDRPIRARGRFGPNGLQGQIIGNEQVGAVSDSIVAAPPAPHSSVKFDSTGAFTVGPDDTLSKDEFLSGAMLSDEQQRRQNIYREAFAPQSGRVYPQRPTLFAWGDSQSFGLAVPDGFHQVGSTLFAIPLEIERTLPKQPFTIPSTFVEITNRGSTQGTSAFYNPRTGRWMQDVTSPTNSFFQFLLPRSVQPCTIERAEIVLKIHAPSRTVTIAGVKDGSPVTIETFESPRGVLTIPIVDTELLQLDSDGGLRFGVTVSKTPLQIELSARELLPVGDRPTRKTGEGKEFDNSTWQIDYLWLRANGETL